MTCGRLRILVTLVVLAAVTVLTGCSMTSSDIDGSRPRASPASTPTPTPTSTPAPTPVVRRPDPPARRGCYRMSLTQATRPTSSADPVPCSGPHTTQTIFVGRLDLVVDGHRLTVDSPRVQRQLASTCPVRLASKLGGSPPARRLSRFEVVWFSPTLSQAARGARWFRCDALALGDERRLLLLPSRARLDGLLDRPRVLATYGLCGTAPPGTRGFHRVACGLRHAWVAVGTIDLAGGDRYPVAARVRAAGNDLCADLVRAQNGSILRFRYGWEWPTAAQWAEGRHYGYCWAPTDLA